jgi:virginiamycin B lyase
MMRRRLVACAAVLVLAAAGPAQAAELAVPTPGAPVLLQSCGAGTRVSGLGVTEVELNVWFEVQGSEAADWVEFYLARSSGPTAEVVWHDAGTFSPGVQIHQTYYQKVPRVDSYGGASCFLTAAHFPSGREWHRYGTFTAADRPTLAADYSLPGQLNPPAVAVGADGTVWLADANGNRFVKIDPQSGTMIGQVPLPTPGAVARNLIAAPDGRLWFTETNAAKVGWIDATGAVHELPVPCSGCHPTTIAAGADGRIWFAQSDDDAAAGVGVVAGGTVTEIPLAAALGHAVGVATAKDGSVWVAESGAKLVHLGPDGKQLSMLLMTTRVPIPNAPPPLSIDWIGLDGAGVPWFAGRRGLQLDVGHVNAQADGQSTTQDTAWSIRAQHTLQGAFDGHGVLWVADTGGTSVFRIVDKVVTIYNVGLAQNESPASPSIATAPDGTLWCADAQSDRLLHLIPH